MIYGQTQFGGVSSILQTKLSKVHEHSPKKSDTVLDTIMHDHSITALEIAKKVLKGAYIGLNFAFFGYFFNVVDKKIITDRLYDQAVWRKFLAKKFLPMTTLGGLCGFAWYILYDQLLCPHGFRTLNRHIAAHAIGGAALSMIFWNPASFVYGAVFGALFGFKEEMKIFRRRMPKDVEIEFGKVDPVARAKAIHDENELQLSRQLLKAGLSMKSNTYVL